MTDATAPPVVEGMADDGVGEGVRLGVARRLEEPGADGLFERVESGVFGEPGQSGHDLETEGALKGGGHHQQAVGVLGEPGQAAEGDVPGGDGQGQVPQRRRRRPPPVEAAGELPLLVEVAQELEEEEGVAAGFPGPGGTRRQVDLLVAGRPQEGGHLLAVEAGDADVLVPGLPGPGR